MGHPMVRRTRSLARTVLLEICQHAYIPQGGETVHAAHHDMNSRMKAAAELLNIGAAVVWTSDLSYSVEVRGIQSAMCSA